MFESFRKKPEVAKSEPATPDVVTFEIPEDALHVMPKQYHGAQPAVKKPKKTVSAGPANPNRRFFLLIGGLALLLGAIVAGFYFYAQYFPTVPAPAPATNTNVPLTNTTPTPTNTTPDITTAEGRDAQRIKDITLLQQALASYQVEFASFPQVLSAIPAKYLMQEPRDPLSSQSYAYTLTNGGSQYALQFVIESQTILNGQVLSAGVHAMGPAGLLPDGQILNPIATSTTPTIPTPPSSDSLDNDNDGLTAAEERSFKTDATNADTDGDGYKDGDEISRLYSPLAGNGAFLNASGLVKLYKNTTFNYSLWVVTEDWITRSMDETNREIIFTAPNGDTVTVLSEPNDSKQTIENWYLARHTDVKQSQLRKFQMSTLSAIKSPDGLAAYATNGTTIFSISYQPAGSAVNYPAIFQLMLNTFKSPAATS